jgi:hypothetical protein
VASQVEVSVGTVSLLLDNQITSCVTTQTVIALHFLYVSCRSRHGRGWAYASLRFELEESGKALLSLPEMTQSNANVELGNKTTSEFTPMTEPPASHDSHSSVVEISNSLSEFRRRLLQFQNYHVSRCRVFVIPCVANPGIGSSSDAEFALVRPAFDLRFLRPLQRFADAHPKFYVSFVFFFLAIPNVSCLILLRDGPSGPFRSIANLVLNSCMVIMFLAVLSSRRHGLDRVAAKYVMSSFRFVTCSVLLAQWISLYILETYNGRIHPTQLAVTVVLALLFLECALLDCSPRFPASAQILISVLFNFCFHSIFNFGRNLQPCPLSNSDCSRRRQVSWWTLFGYFAVSEIRGLTSNRSVDCFGQIGEFDLCNATQKLSIYSSLFLLMTQALISRTFVPGMSNFVNASVRRARFELPSATAPCCPPFALQTFTT